MKSSKYLLLLACAMLGIGLYAEDKSPEPARPEGQPHARRMKRPDFAAMLQLNDAEKKAVEDADTALKEAAKKIREQAMAEAKKSAAVNFDAKLKIYKEAVSRMSDEKARTRAEKMLERLEANRERLIQRMAGMTINPRGDRKFNRPGRHGHPGRPGRPSPHGQERVRPMGPSSAPAEAPAAQ